VRSQVVRAWQHSVLRESRARAPLGLNDSRDYPELLQQARAAASTIANKNTTVRVFTPEDGSNYRQVDNFGLKHRTMFDWLDDVLNVSGDARLERAKTSSDYPLP
jgi:hypothetical protein